MRQPVWFSLAFGFLVCVFGSDGIAETARFRALGDLTKTEFGGVEDFIQFYSETGGASQIAKADSYTGSERGSLWQSLQNDDDFLFCPRCSGMFKSAYQILASIDSSGRSFVNESRTIHSGAQQTVQSIESVVINSGSGSLGHRAAGGQEVVSAQKIRVFLSGDGSLKAEPARIVIPVGRGKADILAESSIASELLLVSRDSKVARYQSDSRSVYGIVVGATEMVAIYQHEALFIPVVVRNHKNTEVDSLVVDEDLVRLTHSSFGPPDTQGAVIEDRVALQAQEAEADRSVFYPETDGLVFNEPFMGTVLDTEWADHQKPISRGIKIRLFDERSSLSSGHLYPVGGAKVSVVGSDRVLVSSRRGIVRLSGIPSSVSIIVQVEDPSGRYMRTKVELDSVASDRESFDIFLARVDNLDRYAEIYGVAQQGDRSSYCGEFWTEDGELDFSGQEVELDVDADGPFYFSDIGPDIGAQVFGLLPRFCFFNVPSGNHTVSLVHEGNLVASVQEVLLSGQHREEKYLVRKRESRVAAIAITSTAAEQLYGDFEKANSLESAYDADLILAATEEPIIFEGPSLVSIPKDTLMAQGRVELINRSGEFESMVYRHDAQAQGGLIKLFPTGFIEDLYHELSMSSAYSGHYYEPSKGAALVEFGYKVDSGDANREALAVSFTLYDAESGEQVEGGWYFGEESSRSDPANRLAKAVFFNLEAGAYSIVVRNTAGEWLAADTLRLRGWMTTYTALGSQPRLPARMPDATSGNM